MRARYIIELREGVRAELLITPSMYAIGERKGITVVIDDTDNPAQVNEAYIKLMYLSALNAWEARAVDDPAIGDPSWKYIDFAQWAAENPDKFADMIRIIFECLTGKHLSEAAKEVDVKKKSSSKRTMTR